MAEKCRPDHTPSGRRNSNDEMTSQGGAAAGGKAPIRDRNSDHTCVCTVGAAKRLAGVLRGPRNCTHLYASVRCDTRRVKSAEFSPELFAHIRGQLSTSDPIHTLSSGRPNWVVGITLTHLNVETERSRGAGRGPQEVPAWMFEAAWQRLTMRRILTNQELVSTGDLNVKRSSLVCAVLAKLPGVTVLDTRPITLTYTPGETHTLGHLRCPRCSRAAPGRSSVSCACTHGT